MLKELKNAVKTPQQVCLLIVLFSVAVSLLAFQSYFLDESVISGDYSFEIEAQKGDRKAVSYLNGVQFYYDFGNDRGNVYFQVGNNDTIKFITIDFPTKIKDGSLKIDALDCHYSSLDCTTESKINFTHHTKLNPVNREDYTTLIIEFLDERLERATFNVQFSAVDFYPNGLFRFYDTGSTQAYFNKKGGAAVFDLGYKYNCVEECYRDQMNTKENLRSGYRTKKVDFVGGEGKTYAFSLKTIRAGMRFLSRLTESFAIALLVGALFLIIRPWYGRLGRKK